MILGLKDTRCVMPRAIHLLASRLADGVDGFVRALPGVAGVSVGRGQVPPPPLGDTVYRPDLRLGIVNRQVDSSDYTGGWGWRCIHEVLVVLLVFLFLVEEENNVGDVGNVAQSEKSLQKFQ